MSRILTKLRSGALRKTLESQASGGMFSRLFSMGNAILKVSEFMTAIVVLVIALIFAIIAYIMVFKWHPRIMAINHTEDLATWMKHMWSDLSMRQTRLLSGTSSNADMPSIRRLIKEVQTHVREEDFTFFYQFYEYHTDHIRGVDGGKWFNRNEKHLIPIVAHKNVSSLVLKKNSTIEIDDARMRAYLNQRFTPLRSLALKCKQYVEKMSDNSGSTEPRSFDDFRTMIDIMTLDLYLNQYRKQIVKMYDTRKTYGYTLQFNIFRLYLTDYIDLIFNKKIKKETWSSFWSEVQTLQKRMVDWYASLEPSVNCLPFTLTGVKSKSGACKKVAAQAEERKRRVKKVEAVEGFVDIIKALFKMVEFFGKVILMLPDIFAILIAIVKALTTPIKMFQMILGLFLSIFIIIAYYISRILLDFASLLIAVVFYTILCVFFTILWLFVLAIVCVIFVILWLLDLLTGGSVLAFLRCENGPDAWIKQRRNNGFSRLFLCSRPCFKSYTSSESGLFCAKTRIGQPPLCPHQYIANLVTHSKVNDETSNGPNDPNDSPASIPIEYKYTYIPTFQLWTMTDKKKRKELIAFHKLRKQYQSVCANEMSEPHIQNMTWNGCANIQHMNISDADKMKARKLCHDIYCESKSAFCIDKDKDIVAEPVIETDVITRTLVVTACVVGAVAIAGAIGSHIL